MKGVSKKISSVKVFDDDLKYFSENSADRDMMVAATSPSIYLDQNLVGEKGGRSQLDLDSELSAGEKNFGKNIFRKVKNLFR